MAPVHLQGKAIAIVMTGIPLALSLGVPAGTFAGGALGWRATFAVMSVLAGVLIVWITAGVPDYDGQRQGEGTPLARVVRIPGVAPVLIVTLTFVLAHTILYTYIAAFLGRLGMGDSVDLVLLVFGIASMASIWIVGVHIDRRLRALTLAGTVLFATAATILAVWADSSTLVYLAVVLWGLGWGGTPTLLQTAVGNAGGEAADAAQAILVTLWNAAMAAGGVVGGLLLGLLGTSSFPWSALALALPVLAVVIGARSHGLPGRRPGSSEAEVDLPPAGKV